MGTLIVSAVLAVMFGLAIRSLYRSRKSGGCGCGCSGCASSCSSANACSCSGHLQNSEIK